jgi:tRNA A37 threonylcarbamoyladenosine synthetase subunit TsaC/SUA5/YrdC
MIDGGECAYGSASTILDLSKERVEVLREGPITKDSILSVL